MSMTFTKLFSSITASTVWGESSDIRIVWITMLAKADKHGRIFASVPGLAHEARVSVSVTRDALRIFQEPDPDSRTKDFEGRRIKEIDGGWALLNYGKYRNTRDEAERKAYKAGKERERRAKKKQDSGQKMSTSKSTQNGSAWTNTWTDGQHVDPRGHNADAEADAEAEKTGETHAQEATQPAAAAPASCEPPPGSATSLDPEGHPETRDLATLVVLASPYFRAKPDLGAAAVNATHRRKVYDAARWEIENFTRDNPGRAKPTLPQSLEVLRRQVENHERLSAREFESYRSKFGFYFEDRPYHNGPQSNVLRMPQSKAGRMMQELEEIQRRRAAGAEVSHG